MKLTLVPESEYAVLYPRNVLGKLMGEDLRAGHTLKMEANRPATFSREVDVRFPLPDFTKVPVDQRPLKPQDAFYTVHRKRLVCPAGSTGCADADRIVVFEVIDEARVQCQATPSSKGPKEVPGTCAPEALEIVTASPPFGGIGASLGLDILFLAWAVNPAAFGLPTRGVVRGTVKRQAYQNGKLAAVPVAGATVSGVSPDEIDPITGEKKPLTFIDGGTSATTTGAGTYALWDNRYTGGPIEVVAISGGTTVRGQGFEVIPGEPNYPRYKHEAIVNLTFPTEAPPPPVPDILVKLVRADNNAIDLKGLAPIGVPLQVGIKSSIAGQQVTINGVEINGVNYSTMSDLTGRYDYILDTPFEPATPGTYRLSSTALRPIGDSVPFGETFRIVAAGGGVDTDNANPPRVIEARTAPKRNAKGVSVGSFVSLSFSEPVKNVLPNLVFTSPEGAVDFKVSAVKPDGTVISDLSTAPTAVVTSVTLEPLQGLKFATRYTVRATSGIEDLDTDATGPAPKSLPAYETSFETFGPESINPDSPDAYSTGGFVILKTDESTTGWALKHQFGGQTWNGAMLGYDASDPANLTQLSNTFIQNRVIDITGEGTTVVVASGTNHRSHPGNLLVFDVTNPAAPEWVGAGTVSSGAMDGTPTRIKMKGDKVYAATWRKGIQVADIGMLKSGFIACCSADYFTMRRDLNLDGGNFNTGAVATTIDVVDPLAPTIKPWMRDLSVIDVEGETIIAVAASIGLVLANEGQSNVFYRAQPSFGGRTMTYAYSVETALIDSRSVILVAGIDGAGQNILIVMEISDPGNPTPIGSMTLATQGKAVADIEIHDGKAYIGFESPTTPQIEIVQIGDPRFPTSAGVVPGVGGRLQVIDGILYGASYGYATEGVIGGIRTAALQQVTLISKMTPSEILVSAANEVFSDTKFEYKVVPSLGEAATGEFHIDALPASRVVTLAAPIDSAGKGDVTWLQGAIVNPLNAYAAQVDVEKDGSAIRALPKRLKLDRVPMAITTRDRMLRIQFALPEQGLFAEKNYSVRVFMAVQGQDFGASPAFTVTSTEIANAYPNVDNWWNDVEAGSANQEKNWVTRKIDTFTLPTGLDKTIRRQGFEIGTILAGYPKFKVVVISDETGKELNVKEGVVSADGQWSLVMQEVSDRVKKSNGDFVPLFPQLPDPGAFDSGNIFSRFTGMVFRVAHVLDILSSQTGIRFVQGVVAGFKDGIEGDKETVGMIRTAFTNDPRHTAKSMSEFFVKMKESLPTFDSAVDFVKNLYTDSSFQLPSPEEAALGTPEMGV